MPAPVPQSRALYLVIGLLAATLGHGAEQAAKPDDGLLDPAEIGAKRAPAASGGLLDPTTLGAHAEVKTSGRALQPALDGGESPGTGRAMASSVVAALDGLTRACADLVHEMENLNRSIGDMAAKLSDLQFNRIVTMSEYRNGLFCSGCNKTRSQILATGSTFPHQGQKAVEATPQMIADKEKELDGPIDSLRRELQEAQDKLQKVQAERDEALVQIQVGYHLWVTGISSQHVLIAAADRASEARYQQEYGKAQAKLATLSVEFIRPDDLVRLADHQREVKTWTAARERAADQRAADQQQIRIDYAKAGRAARNDCDQLNGYFGREGVRQVLTLVAVVRLLSPRTGFNAEGGLFRMGDYSPAHHDQVVSSVRGFISHFDAMPSAEFRVFNNFLETGPSLPPNTDVIPTARKELRELLEALPAKDGSKPKDNSFGTRG